MVSTINMNSKFVQSQIALIQLKSCCVEVECQTFGNDTGLEPWRREYVRYEEDAWLNAQTRTNQKLTCKTVCPIYYSYFDQERSLMAQVPVGLTGEVKNHMWNYAGKEMVEVNFKRTDVGTSQLIDLMNGDYPMGQQTLIEVEELRKHFDLKPEVNQIVEVTNVYHFHFNKDGEYTTDSIQTAFPGEKGVITQVKANGLIEIDFMNDLALPEGENMQTLQNRAGRVQALFKLKLNPRETGVVPSQNNWLNNHVCERKFQLPIRHFNNNFQVAFA